MNRAELSEKIIAAKDAKDLRWRDIAQHISKPQVWTIAALMGQHALSPESAAEILDLLGIEEQGALDLLSRIPMRGSLPQAVPTDPTVYRFYEAIQVYGPALKEAIHEEFGDGIMSAINFSLNVERKVDAGGDRVVVTFSGKFLPYEWK